VLTDALRTGAFQRWKQCASSARVRRLPACLPAPLYSASEPSTLLFPQTPCPLWRPLGYNSDVQRLSTINTSTHLVKGTVARSACWAPALAGRRRPAHSLHTRGALSRLSVT
jgi:hypothetical protein